MSLPRGSIKKLNETQLQNAPFLMLQAHPSDYYKMNPNIKEGIQDESAV